MCFVKMNVEFDWYRYLFAGRKKMCPTKTKFEILSLSIFSYFFFFFCCFVGLSAAGFFFCRRMETNEKKIFSLQTKKKVNPNEFEITALLFLTFLLCLVYLFIYLFSHCCCCFCWLVEKRVSVVRERMFLLLLMSKCVLSMDTLQ